MNSDLFIRALEDCSVRSELPDDAEPLNESALLAHTKEELTAMIPASKLTHVMVHDEKALVDFARLMLYHCDRHRLEPLLDILDLVAGDLGRCGEDVVKLLLDLMLREEGLLLELGQPLLGPHDLDLLLDALELLKGALGVDCG